MKKTSLSSRERVTRAINHQEPDRVPFDMTLTVDIYHDLRKQLGLPPDPDEKVGIWSEVSLKEDFIEKMNLDFIYLGLNPPSRKPKQSPDGALIYDQWGVGRAKMQLPNGSYYFEAVEHPLSHATLKDIEEFAWPDPYDPVRLEGVREKFLRIRKETDKAIVARFSTSIWEQATYSCGLQNWLEMMVFQPEIACAILDKLADISMGMTEVGVGEIGDLIDIIRISGEDLGSQTATIISPRMYETFVRPRFQRSWAFVRQQLQQKGSQAKIMLHSCGAIRPLLTSWIEMGLDILDPIQPLAKGMQPEGLKRDFGQRLVFHGGVDLQQLLPNGTREEVWAGVHEVIRALAPGGGFIISPAHNVQSDVPAENLIALRDAIEEYGYYPIR